MEEELALVKEQAMWDLQEATAALVALRRQLSAAKTLRSEQLNNHPSYGDAHELYEWWKAQSGRNGRTRFTEPRLKVLVEALEEFDKREVAQAIKGCLWSDWHVQNGQTDLTLILRKDKIDTFVERYHTERERRRQAFSRLPERARPIDRFLGALSSYTPSPSEAGTWAAHCPLHKDGLPSLFVRETEGGGVSFVCFEPCSPDEIISELNLTWAELRLEDHEAAASA